MAKQPKSATTPAAVPAQEAAAGAPAPATAAAAVAEVPAAAAQVAPRSRTLIESARRVLNERRAKRVMHELVYDDAAITEADEIVARWEEGKAVPGVSLFVPSCKHEETQQLVMRCAREILQRPHPRSQQELRERCLAACQGWYHQIAQFETAIQFATLAVLCGWSLVIETRASTDELEIPGLPQEAAAS